MDFIKKIFQNRKIKKTGLTETEYKLLHKLDKSRPTKSTITQELYNEKIAKSLFSITVKEQAQKTIDNLISLGVYRSYKSRYNLTTKGEKLLTAIGKPIENKFHNKTLSPNSSASITVSTWFFISLVQIIIGLIAKSYGLFSVGLIILLKISFPILSWATTNKKTTKNITKIISASFLIAGIPMVIIGIIRLFNTSFIDRSLVATATALLSALALGLLIIYQNQVLKKKLMFSLAFLNNKTTKFFLLSLTVVVAALASFFGIPLLDPIIMLLIGSGFTFHGVTLFRELHNGKNRQKTILINWFQKLSKQTRKRFFELWLKKIISEKPVLKSEILTIYKKSFGAEKTSLFLNMFINIAYDDFFEERLDRYLAHLLYAKSIEIADDKFQIRS